MLQTLPMPLDAPIIENNKAKMVSCGARHSAILTGTTSESNKQFSYFISPKENCIDTCYE